MIRSSFAIFSATISFLVSGVPAQAIDLAAIKARKYPSDAKEEAHVCAALFAIAQLMEQADQARPPHPGQRDNDDSGSAVSPEQRRAESELKAEEKAESDRSRSAMFASMVTAWGDKAAKLSGQNVDTYYDTTLQEDANSLASLKSAFPFSPSDVRAFPDVTPDSWLGRCSAKFRANIKLRGR